MSTETDNERLSLSQNDLNSRTWKTMEKYLQARIDQLRRQNDNDMPADRTALLRGRIGELKLILLAAGESQD